MSVTAKQQVKDFVIDAIADVLRRAKEAAIAADPGQENDGGTCNFDTPAFRIDRFRVSDIALAAERAGLTVTPFKWFGGKTWYWLNVPLNGQGNRRTTMMEAAQRVLNDACPDADRPGVHPSFHACGYMQCD